MAKANMTRRTWILLGVFVLTAVVGLVVISSKSLKQAEVESLQQTIKEESTGTATVPGVKTGTAQQTKLYTQLVSEYRDRRIQFDAMCQAIPSNVTYKNGTKVMFDNRSGDARYISVGGVSYYLAGYGYKILTLSSKTLPKNLLISCGAAVNVGQILLQN